MTNISEEKTIAVAKLYMRQKGYKRFGKGRFKHNDKTYLTNFDKKGTFCFTEVVNALDFIPADPVASDSERAELEEMAIAFLELNDLTDKRIRFDRLSVRMTGDGRAFTRYHVNVLGAGATEPHWTKDRLIKIIENKIDKYEAERMEHNDSDYQQFVDGCVSALEELRDDISTLED